MHVSVCVTLVILRERDSNAQEWARKRIWSKAIPTYTLEWNGLFSSRREETSLCRVYEISQQSKNIDNSCILTLTLQLLVNRSERLCVCVCLCARISVLVVSKESNWSTFDFVSYVSAHISIRQLSHYSLKSVFHISERMKLTPREKQRSCSWLSH